MEFLAWLEATPLGAYIRESFLGYPLVLAAHSIGMGVVVGVVLILSLRILGYSKRVPVTAFDTLINVAWGGFVLNAASGVLLFCGNATKLAVNLPFQLKLLFILLGGISVWALWRMVGRGQNVSADGIYTRKARILAWVCIVLWLAAILSGRLIGYTIKYY